ncbi:MAG: hypothetical protein NZ903_01630 [Candidatus Micrarchaeota archaeon]|nr:hypothetical protein [Candidatus Micrarchaeota archaeon]
MDFKSHIVRKAVETDDVTYVRVLPDQVCDMPILPIKYPVRQLNWTVSLNKGAIYLPKDGIYCRILDVGYGAIVNCSVFGKEGVTIESGAGIKGSTLINGSVISDGKIRIVHPKSKEEDYNEEYLIVKGDIFGGEIEIEAPSIVLGSVVSSDHVLINDNTIVYGSITSNKVYAQKLTCNFIAGDYLEIGDCVSVFTPTVLAKEIKLEKLRVISPICRDCNKKELKEILLCDFNQCSKCIILSNKDLIDFSDYKILTTSWRTINEDEDRMNWIRQLLSDIYYERWREIEEIEKLKYLGLSDSLKIKIDMELKPEIDLEIKSEKKEG